MDLAEAREIAQMGWPENQKAQRQHDTVDWLIAEVERLQEDHGKACHLVAKMHFAATGSTDGPQRGVVEDVEDSLTRSKAEGRREAFEEAAKIAEGWRGTMSMFLHAEDCRAHNTACGQIAAAIRQQAVLGKDGPTKDQETIIYLEADLGAAKEKLKQIEAIADHAPELNMSNYDVDQVAALNTAMIEIYNVLQADEGGEQI